MKQFENEELNSSTPEWRYWSPTLAVHLFLVCNVNHKTNKITFTVDRLSLYTIIIYHKSKGNPLLLNSSELNGI